MHDNKIVPVLKLLETRVWRTYTGGTGFDKWRGRELTEAGHYPEDWVASTVEAINPNSNGVSEGLSIVKNLDGEKTLLEVIEANKEAYFGKKHLEQVGDTAGMLIKMIDSYERLTIQVHPDKKFAKEHFQSDYGKTESWYVLDTLDLDGDEACIYFGFKPHVTKEMWREIFDKQDIDAMLDCLHRIPVKSGDCFFIPGGLPHAIGKGCFLAEVQEPTDLTIRTERVTPAGLKIDDRLIHQNLGFDLMFDSFHYNGDDLEETCRKWKVSPRELHNSENGSIHSLIDDRSTDLFTMNVMNVQNELVCPEEESLRIWIVLEGSGELITDAETVSLEKCDYILIPSVSTNCKIKASSTMKIIECLPQKTK